MDSVIIFFGGKTHAAVEAAAEALGVANGTLTHRAAVVYLHRYLPTDWTAELDEAERLGIERLLGGPIQSAFQLSCRHNVGTRVALELAASLMASQAPAVLDDDFGGCWTADALLVRLQQSPVTGLFDLRNRSEVD